MNLNVSPQVAEIVDRAAAGSVHRGQFYVGVEHLFAAILDTPDDLPARVRDQYLNTFFTVLREVNRDTRQASVPSTTGEVFHTPRCIKILNQTNRLAQRAGTQGQAGHLLLAILGDGLSAPSRAMDALKQNRGECLTLLETSLLGVKAKKEKGAASGQTVAMAASATPESEAAEEAAAAVERMTRSLTSMARHGKLNPTIGRDEEIFEILQVLARKSKNNVILVGEAGVGKTQAVEGLATKLLSAEDGGGAEWSKYEILELNVGTLLAGTQYRGAFEEKLLGLLEQLKQDPYRILFIDEMHLIMGAGSTEGGGVDMANLLKPALARGEIRCIGATTLQEYRKFVEKDPAIERRFQMVRLEELSEDATLEVLKRLRPGLEKHHNVKISSRALAAAVQLTQRHLPNRRLPDKAIDALDQACARFRLKVMAAKSNLEISGFGANTAAELKVTPHDIRKVVSQSAGIAIEEVTERERMHLTDLHRILSKRIIGQDEAVSKAVAAVKKSRAGMADPNRPDAVMLFVGPTGVGKTQLAKSLADQLFGSRSHLVTFDMSEYVEEHSVSRLLGAPPGYAGSEEEGRLSAAVRGTPFCILLFDEIEKAHPRIFDIFLPIFDEGRIKDSRGREVSFRNCIIILTSNIGAALFSRGDVSDVSGAMTGELRKHFRPEFINRIDEIVPFYPLLAEDIRKILRIEMKVVQKRLEEKGIGFRVYQRAYEQLAQEAYSPEFGARELRRIVDRRLVTPISDLIVSASLKRGDVVEVLMQGDDLFVRTAAPEAAAVGRA